MIDHDKKFIFVHITRTGGSSVERALGGKLQDHRKVKKYQEIYGKNIFNDFFSFTTVRNPWDKVVSHFSYQRERVRKYRRGGHPLANLTFTEYIEALTRSKLAPHDMRQFTYLSDKEGNVVVNSILRFENLQTGFDAICRRIGVKASLPHKNFTRRAHYSLYYNSRSRDLVGNIFQKDIDFFDYKFDN